MLCWAQGGPPEGMCWEQLSLDAGGDKWGCFDCSFDIWLLFWADTYLPDIFSADVFTMCSSRFVWSHPRAHTGGDSCSFPCRRWICPVRLSAFKLPFKALSVLEKYRKNGWAAPKCSWMVVLLYSRLLELLSVKEVSQWVFYSDTEGDDDWTWSHCSAQQLPLQ